MSECALCPKCGYKLIKPGQLDYPGCVAAWGPPWATTECLNRAIARLRAEVASVETWAKRVIDWDPSSEIRGLPALLDAVELDLNAEHERAIAAESLLRVYQLRDDLRALLKRD
jgi:hypothetical protein